MADPLTALMYAVQVMKLLKSLTEKTGRERAITSSQVDARCSNEAGDDKKEEDDEEEQEEEEQGDGVYKTKEEGATERIRVVADEHKSRSMKSEFEGSSASDSKEDDGPVQPPICIPNRIGSK